MLDFFIEKLTATNVIITDYNEGKKHTFYLGVFPVLQTLSHTLWEVCHGFSDIVTLSQ